MMLNILSCVCWLSVYLLWRNVYLGLLPIFGLGCLVFFDIELYESCLYILEIKLLLVASFANIFSQSIGYLFILFIVSFAVQKLVSFIRSHLFIFAFISIALGNLYIFIIYNDQNKMSTAFPTYRLQVHTPSD